MADYKHRAAPKKRTRQHDCGKGLWFFGGFLIGAFAMGLVWLKLGPELEAGRIPGASPTKPGKQTEPRNPAPKPEFEFYTILPEIEVIIPDEEILPPRAEKPAPKPARERSAPDRNHGKYVLQMGSFRKHADADRMKARLALIGIVAHIQKVSINNRDTYHRVRSGPYQGQSELNRVRKLAKQNKISTLVIKLKQ
jgi:cell division protein FtsN